MFSSFGSEEYFLSLFAASLEKYISRIEFRWLHFAEEARNSPGRRLRRKLHLGEARHPHRKKPCQDQLAWQSDF